MSLPQNPELVSVEVERVGVLVKILDDEINNWGTLVLDYELGREVKGLRIDAAGDVGEGYIL